jgi:hypothetical protein
MEQRIIQRDVPLGEHRFRLKKMDARTGTWLYALLSAKASPSGGPITLMQTITAFHSASKDDYAMIQQEVLKRTYLLEETEGKEFESIILAPNGNGFSFDFLTYDTETIFQLTDLGVIFNISPFFTERASNSPPQLPPDGNL